MILYSLEELENDLRIDGLRPLYLILGPEMYQCGMAISLLKSKALSPEAIVFDYSELSAEDAPANRIVEAINTFPMLSKRRLVLITQVDKLADSKQDELLDLINDISARSVLILAAEDLDRRKRFYKTLREKACIAEFPKLKGFALERRAEIFARKQGYRISAAAIKKIVNLAGSDLRTLAGEIEKVLLFAGKEKNIPDSAVDDLVRGSRQQSVFELIDALGRRDRAGALRSLANLLDLGEPLPRIVATMARHYRQILIAKELMSRGCDPGEMINATQVQSYFLDKLLQQARSIDAVTAQKMYMSLAGVDTKLKSTSLDGRILLEELICALA